MSNRVVSVDYFDSPVRSSAKYTQLPRDEPSCSSTSVPAPSSPAERRKSEEPYIHPEDLNGIVEDDPVQDDGLQRELSVQQRMAGHNAQWQFVESTWFRTFVILSVLASNGMIVLELAGSDLHDIFDLASICITGLISFEVLAKCLHQRAYFFCDYWSNVVWNLLDVFLVALAVLDNVFTFCPFIVEDASTAAQTVVTLKFVRLLQIVKALNTVLDADLSWADRPWFQSFIGGVIMVNAALMGFETDIESSLWAPIEQLLLLIYTAELLVQMKKQGARHFLSSENFDVIWNWLDFIIVVSSAADSWGLSLLNIYLHALAAKDSSTEGHKKKGENMSLAQVMMLMRMLRLLRILRLVKLIKAVKPLYILVVGISAAVQGVFWVLVLTIVSLYAMSIMATRLIGHGLVFTGREMPDADVLEIFGTVPDSIFILFRVMSGQVSDAEAEQMDSLMSATPTMKFSFVFFMVAGSWTLLSILTAVVSEKMITTCNDETLEQNMITYEEDRELHKQQLKNLFLSLDVNGNGILEFRELDPVLANPLMAKKIAKICRIPARNVRDCFITLSRNGGQSCPLDHFVECMLDCSKVKTEQSVMKIQAKLLDALHELEDHRQTQIRALERILDIIKQKETKHFHSFMEVSQKHAESETRHAELILEMEQKNAAQEQRHADTVTDMVQKNGQIITSVLEVVNALAVRQQDIESKRLMSDSQFGERLVQVEKESIEDFDMLRHKIESICGPALSLETACNSSSTLDTSLEQVSTNLKSDMEEESQQLTSSNDDLPCEAGASQVDPGDQQGALAPEPAGELDDWSGL